MIYMFDEDTFMALSGLKLGEYFERIQSSAFPCLDVNAVTRLLEPIDNLDYEHALYLIQMGIHFRVPGISDIAVRYLKREVMSGGPRYSVMKMLRDAHDMTQEHIDQIEAIQFDRKYIPAFDAFMQVFNEGLDILRRKVAVEARQRAQEDASDET